MENNPYLFMNISILYRSAQKYFDKQLLPYSLGAGQLQFLLLIYENEGITMQKLASLGSFDKGTITKGIQKLEDLGYVVIKTSSQDKRARLLYTTEKTKNIIGDIYLIRREWWEKVSKSLPLQQKETFEQLLQVVAKEAGNFMDEQEQAIKFFGLQKLTLLDYPGKVACTLFTGGCNLRCPYCQNSDLVFLPENLVEISKDEVMDFLKKRQGVLEGICISGGEPLLHDELEPFLKEVKALGYQVKLDTNGTFPDKLRYLVENKLVDYVAMDIKNDLDHYFPTVGIQSMNLEALKQSVAYLLEGHCDYEFRTTCIKEFHTLENMQAIGKWIKGAKRFYLQNFVDRPSVLQPGLHGFSKEELEKFRECLLNDLEQVEIRGV